MQCVRQTPAAPTVTKASGQIAVEFAYPELNRVKTAAGDFDAHGFSKVLTSKIGPTVIDTTLYVFYAQGTGQVARIDHTDVHALILYNRDTRAGYLLEQSPKPASP